MTTTAINPTTETKKRINNRNLKGAARKSDCKRYAEMCLNRLNIGDEAWVLEDENDSVIGKSWYTWDIRYTGEFNYLSAKAVAQIHNLLEMVHGSVYITTYDRGDSNDEGLLISLRFVKDITDY